MRRYSYSIVVVLIAGSLVSGCGGKPQVDYGDGSTTNLLYLAFTSWKTDKDLDRTLLYADKLIETYGDEAKEMQASLSGFPSTDPPEETYKVQALNHVGVAYWIRGEVLLEKGDKAGARQAFETLVQQYGYAQYQDSNNEWVKAAELAGARLEELGAGAE